MVRSGLFAIATATLSCSLTGCLAIYSKRPVEVTVTSTVTEQPLANLPVSVNYGGMLILNRPKSASGVTDESGRVLLPIADFDSGISITAGDCTGSIKPETVREGGTVGARYSPSPDATPRVIMQLVPQRRSFAHRFFGSLK